MHNRKRERGASRDCARRSRTWVEDLEPRHLLAAGTLDASFGHGGVDYVSPTAPKNVRTIAAVALPGGKTAVLGEYSTRDANTFAIQELNADGTADASFAGGGILVPPLRTEVLQGQTVFVDSTPRGIVVDARGNLDVLESDALVRVKPDGTIDTTFGDNGAYVFPFGLSGHCIIRQADGSLLIGGTTPALGQFGYDLAILRIPNGSAAPRRFGSKEMAVVRFALHGRHVDSSAYALAIAPGGDIVAAGGGDGFLEMARFHTDGVPDASFGAHGTIRIAPLGVAVGHGTSSSGVDSPLFASVAVRASDGEIFAAGTVAGDQPALTSSTPFELAAFTPAGLPDAQFGVDGVVTESFGSRRLPSAAQADSVTIGADGRPIVAGSVTGRYGTGAVLARFNADGSADPTFAVGLPAAVASETGFRLIAATHAQGGFAASFSDPILPTADGFMLPLNGAIGKSRYVQTTALRFDSAGNLVRTFGHNGVAVAPVQTYDQTEISSVWPSTDGGAYVRTIGTTSPITRLNADGTADMSFGSGERSRERNNGNLVGVQSDGKLLLAPTPFSDAYLTRIDASGVPDQTFGSGGTVTLHSASGSLSVERVLLRSDGWMVAVLANFFPSVGVFPNYRHTLYLLDPQGRVRATRDLPSDVFFGQVPADTDQAVAPDGQVVVAYHSSSANPPVVTGVMRFNADDLTPDGTFGQNGNATGFPPDDNLDRIDVLPDNRIVLAGTTTSGNGVLTRLNVDGSVDATFANQGYASIDKPLALLTQSDGRILVVGDDSSSITVQRYLEDGSVDASFGANGQLVISAPLENGNAGRRVSAAIGSTGGGESLYLASEIYNPKPTDNFPTGREVGIVLKVNL